MKKSKRKIALMSIGILLIVALAIGISYAWWSYQVNQSGVNIVETDCFKLEFKDKNAINISKAHPIEDEEGLKSVPYTFTITNVCNSSASYQVNLETMGVEGKKLPDKYLKVNLQEGTNSKITTKLDKEVNSELNTNTTITGAIEAYKLVTGILNPNEEKEYNLRVWMDSEVGVEEDSMNATYQGKISISASYIDYTPDERGTLRATSGYGYDDTTAFYNYRNSITKVVFEDTMNPKETELSWDVSETQDGSVMSYLVLNESDTTKYTLYIQSKGGVKAPTNSSHLFYGFTNLTTIENLELLDTSNVTDMSYMFSHCSNLTSLDVSNFDTSNVTDMQLMFAFCSRLTNLDIRHFKITKETRVDGMLVECTEDLDLSNFDEETIRTMYSGE